MNLYTNGGNIHLENCIRFISLTMYNMPIFYLAPLMFSRSSHFLISGLHAGNTKIKGPTSLSRLAWSLPIVSFHAWLLFSSMHVASDDRFVSFKAGGNHKDDSFFFFRAEYRMAGREEQPKKKSHKKIVLLLTFLVVGDTQVRIRWAPPPMHGCPPSILPKSIDDVGDASACVSQRVGPQSVTVGTGHGVQQ